MKNKKLAIATVTVFATGYFVGSDMALKRIKKKLTIMQPIVASTFSNIILKAQDQTLSSAEVGEYVATELDFLGIVLRGENATPS